MKTPEEWIERNIKIIKSNPEKFSGEFGVSRLQRVIRISYNQAAHTCEKALNQGLFDRASKPYLYKLNIVNHGDIE